MKPAPEPEPEALTIAFNRAVRRHFRGGPVSTLEIKIACAAILQAYLEQIPIDERKASFAEFVGHLAGMLGLIDDVVTLQ